MSNLSQRCKQYLEITGHTVYSLAKSSGLDRASIHRLVTGSRLPSLEFLTNFCDYLRINAEERNDIFELYQEAKVGPAIYKNRKYIERMISTITELQKNGSLGTSAFSSVCADAKLMDYTDTVMQTSYQIYNLLEKACCQTGKTSDFFCNLPVSLPFSIFEIIQQLYLKYHMKINFWHLITFAANPASQVDTSCNLRILHHILPFVFSGFDTYHPYYIYSQASRNDYLRMPWPYYIMTDDAILILSADASASILHTNQDFIRLYRQEIQKVFKDARPLLSISHTLEESLQLYLSNSWPANSIVGYMENLPCLLPYITPKQLVQGFQTLQISPDTLSALGKATDTHPNAPSYFTRDGLLDFWKTGQIKGQIASYLPPFTPKQRQSLLQHFIKGNDGTVTNCKILKLNIVFPENFYVELLSNNQILFCMFDYNQSIRFILFDESSVCEAFVDFFQYLNSETSSYSLLETNCYISHLLKGHLDGVSADQT